MVSIRDISEAVRQLGLSRQPLCVHSSLRSFGWVEGGASAVLDGLLSEGCTVMVPAFSWTFAVPPSGARPARNAWDYDTFEGPRSGIGCVYTSDSTEIDKEDMGAVAAAIVARPERIRGDHPLCSFAAVGPLANELIAGQRPLHVWAPLEALVDVSGSVLLMGVGLEKMTLLHLAEQVAGRNPFRRWANGPEGTPTEVQVGGCSHGFDDFESVLAPFEGKAMIGASVWRVFPAKATVDAAARAMRRDPMISHCGDPECGRCNDAVLGGPILTR
jgi:aminoglycoside N3'-acetyltransferase